MERITYWNGSSLRPVLAADERIQQIIAYRHETMGAARKHRTDWGNGETVNGLVRQARSLNRRAVHVLRGCDAIAPVTHDDVFMLTNDQILYLLETGQMRVWGSAAHTRDSGFRFGASDITSHAMGQFPLLEDQNIVHSIWRGDLETVSQDRDGGLHIYLLAENEEQAMEVAASTFCWHANVPDVDRLRTWSADRYREDRQYWKERAAAQHHIGLAAKVPTQAALF